MPNSLKPILFEKLMLSPILFYLPCIKLFSVSFYVLYLLKNLVVFGLLNKTYCQCKQIKIHRTCPGELDDVVKQLEEATGSVVVGQIGRTVIIYRPSLTKLKAEEKKKQARKVFVRREPKLKPTLQVKDKNTEKKKDFIFVLYKTSLAFFADLPNHHLSKRRVKGRYQDYLGVVAGEAAGSSSKITFVAMCMHLHFWCHIRFPTKRKPVAFSSNRRVHEANS